MPLARLQLSDNELITVEGLSELVCLPLETLVFLHCSEALVESSICVRTLPNLTTVCFYAHYQCKYERGFMCGTIAFWF